MGGGSLNFSENAMRVLKKRYLAKNEKGEVIETPEEMFRRVAKNIAEADRLYGKNADIKGTEEEFYEAMTNLEFLPNSPTLMNAGRDLQQLSACFVLPIMDSMESIFEAVKDTSLIHKSGGGTGFSFSQLRPKNSQVRSTGGVASGPVSFLKVFDAATQAVKQGGCVAPNTRIATEMGLLRIKELGPVNTPADSWHKYNPHPVVVATDNGPQISDEFYNHGVSLVRTIKTKNGYKVTGTLQHRLRVIAENGEYVWRYIKDIKIGDWVVLQKDTYMPDKSFFLSTFSSKPHFNAQKINIPKKATPQLGEFIGYLVGDGAISLNERGTGRLILSVSDKEKDVARYILRIAKELFGITAIPQKKKDDLSTNYFFNSTHLVKWLHHIDVYKPSASEIYVPNIVFKAGRQFANGFLRGLFSADGAVTEEGYPSLCTVSKILVEDLQQLLLSLGIPSSIGVTRRRNKSFGKRPLYRIRIITQEGIERFTENIGFISKKKNKRLMWGDKKAWEFNPLRRNPRGFSPGMNAKGKVISASGREPRPCRLRRRGRGGSTDILPNQEEVLCKVYNGPGRGCAPKRKSRGANRPLYRNLQHYLPKVAASRNLSRKRLKRLAELHPEVNNHPVLSWFLTNKQFYDRVVKVKEGKSLTLDLSVPANNTYIANGFVSHNTRRGANMGILRIDHPDILEFITCKENDKEITNFNISVTITEDFMRKVDTGEDYDLIDPHTKKVVKKLNAREVFNLIVKMAWKNGEPGIVFIDKMNEFNPTPKLGLYESTNPCGEQILLPHESCNLGSVNLSKVVSDGKIDWNRLAKIVKTAVHFLDNVIDMNNFPLKKIEEMTRANRKIGLGVMGFADMLIELGIPYNSDEAVAIADKLMSFVLNEARKASSELAKERGTFPNFEDSIYNRPNGSKQRNATLTTIAPTGSLSIIADCSSGIEPLFAIVYYKEVMDKDRLPEVNRCFVKIAKEKEFWSEELLKKIAQKGSIQDLPQIPDDVKQVFVTSHDISPEWHIKIQAAFQQHTDNAVSKTINFPQESTEDDIRKAYMLAHRMGCKGVTVYRDRSREEQVLNIEKKIEEEASSKIIPRPRPSVIYGSTTKIATGCGNLYVTINEDENGLPFEVFMQMGKAGGCAMSQLEAIGRLLSLALRSGIEINSITEQLRGIRCPSPSWEKGGRIFSCSDAIARVIEKRLVKAKKTDLEGSGDNIALMSKEKTGNIVGVCPDCGGALWHIEGCMICKACGYSKCG